VASLDLRVAAVTTTGRVVSGRLPFVLRDTLHALEVLLGPQLAFAVRLNIIAARVSLIVSSDHGRRQLEHVLAVARPRVASGGQRLNASVFRVIVGLVEAAVHHEVHEDGEDQLLIYTQKAQRVVRLTYERLRVSRTEGVSRYPHC